MASLQVRRARARSWSTRLAATLSLAAALAFFVGGCRVTANDVDAWKGTVKGPTKMEAVLLADKYELPLRTHAALSLVTMERNDVNGVETLKAALQKLDSNVRQQIIAGVVPGLLAAMKAGGVGDPDLGPPSSQVRAKDAAFMLTSLATADSKAALTEGVIGWYAADFSGRNLSGAYSAEQVVRALGSPAANALTDAIQAKLPQQALVKLVELISQLGAPETKKRAASKLVAVEQEMRGEPFLKWLESEIAATLKDAGESVDAERVKKTALLNRLKFIEDGVLPSMKYLASEPEVAERLLKIAEAPGAALQTQRVRALQALEGSAKEEHLDRLLALALDEKNPTTVRDYAFDRVGDIRSPRALSAMWPLVQSAENQRLRWRAGELVLVIGGAAVLPEFFAKLPGGDVSYEPEELDGYAGRMGQITPPPDDIARGQLASPDWWDRVIALRYFQRRGGQSNLARDLAALEPLTKDKAEVAGEHWEKGTTVGTVAQEAITAIRDRGTPRPPEP
jgi:hypothetical protein